MLAHLTVSLGASHTCSEGWVWYKKRNIFFDAAPIVLWRKSYFDRV
jgi:hypothetical protein